MLHLAGAGRSGGTILAQTLGAIDGWLHVGELKAAPTRRCGCGAPVYECELWGPVFAEVRGRHPEFGARPLEHESELGLGGGLAGFASIARARRRPPVPRSRLERFADLLADLHRAVADAAPARVVVDSSRSVLHPYLLASFTDSDLYVLHLVRDPRAVAHSWGRELGHSSDPAADLPRTGPSRSTYLWLRRNALIEATLRRALPPARFLRLRYEDFVTRPRQTLDAVCALIGEREATLPLRGERAVELRPSHTIAGNPHVRFLTGERALRLDDEWRAEMTSSARLRATLIAAPLLARYDYPLRP